MKIQISEETIGNLVNLARQGRYEIPYKDVEQILVRAVKEIELARAESKKSETVKKSKNNENKTKSK